MYTPVNMFQGQPYSQPELNTMNTSECSNQTYFQCHQPGPPSPGKFKFILVSHYETDDDR